MATINSNDSRTRNAQNLIESYNEADGDASAYLFIGKPQPWENDAEPPNPVNNFKEYYQVHNDMLSLKRINDLDVHMMVPRVSWTSGAVYDMYRHDYSQDTPSFSGASNLFDAVYYVLSSNNYVYVCLNNNNDRPSLVEPQNVSDQPFVTSDDYQWLRLYKVNVNRRNNYSTKNYIPIDNEDVHLGVPGAIHTVVVNESGSRYTANPDGPIAKVADYFCDITGDGEGAVAKVRVRSGKITQVKVVRPGRGYTHAKVDFNKNRVFKGLKQLDDKRNPLDPEGDGRFSSTVIIGPPGGWGYITNERISEGDNERLTVDQLARQLSSRTVGVFTTIKYDLNDFFPDATFRQVGILSDPDVYDEYLNNETLSAVHALKVTTVSGPNDFIIGEQIRQIVTNPDDIYNRRALGTVVGWDPTEGIVRYIQTRDNTSVDGNVYELEGGKQVTGMLSRKVVDIEDFDGELTGLTFLRGKAEPEFEKHSGYITYLANVPPIERNPTQSERISLTISF